METKSQAQEAALYNKENPLVTKVTENYLLNKEGSIKDTRHIAISLEASGVDYTPGDSLYIFPENDPELVKNLLNELELDLSSEEETKRFTQEVNLTRPSSKLFKAIAEKTGEDAKEIQTNFDGYNSLVIIKETKSKFPDFKITSNELAENSSKANPRAYSIASSLKAHPELVELCISRVEEEINGQMVYGLCSNFICNRVAVGDEKKVRVYVHKNDRFRLPEDPKTKIIMVGPGTGIAPFRAFIEERNALRDSGTEVGADWLFFGDQRSKFDYLYGEELENYKEKYGLKIDLAFSRDQNYKIYVQDKMRENSAEIFQWLEEGAHFYVCGDARRMAKDVDQALKDIASEHGKDPEEFIKALKDEKRYSRDVY